MRKLLVLIAAAAATACGNSSSGGNALTGTVAGKAFSPADVEAIVAGTGSSPCPITIGTTTMDVGVKALAILATSYSGACGDFASTQCKFHENAQSITIVLAILNPAGAEPTIAPGTYTVNASATTVTPYGTGLLVAAFAPSLATNATCAGTPSPSVQGGTVRIDSVAGPVTGHVYITFQDGSSIGGDFSAPICGVTPNVCSLATAQALCTLPPTCVP